MKNNYTTSQQFFEACQRAERAVSDLRKTYQIYGRPFTKKDFLLICEDLGVDVTTPDRLPERVLNATSDPKAPIASAVQKFPKPVNGWHYRMILRSMWLKKFDIFDAYRTLSALYLDHFDNEGLAAPLLDQRETNRIASYAFAQAATGKQGRTGFTRVTRQLGREVA